MILIAFGSNLNGLWGTSKETVERALIELEGVGIEIICVSTLIETAPYGNPNQPSFINAVALVRTHKSPYALMRTLLMIERRAGRKRGRRWGPRTLDLDLIDYHGLVRRRRSLDIKPLVLPHPGILLRSFVLAPIAEIAAQWRHPLTHQTAQDALRHLGH
jgi:2-amino-4-hydroxy-6-hydroxymethyldihydropteridine diphosphokinase